MWSIWGQMTSSRIWAAARILVITWSVDRRFTSHGVLRQSSCIRLTGMMLFWTALLLPTTWKIILTKEKFVKKIPQHALSMCWINQWFRFCTNIQEKLTLSCDTEKSDFYYLKQFIFMLKKNLHKCFFLLSNHVRLNLK